MLTDIRFRRLLEDIIVPTGKEDMNPRSPAYLRVALMGKRKCVLFATFPKSGWNWTSDILGYCVIKLFTGEYDIKYEGEGTLKERQRKPYRLFHPADSRALKGKKVREIFSELDIDYCFHSHGFWKESPLWGLDEAKTVFVVRNIPTTLFSYYKSRTDGKFSSFEDCLHEGGALDRIIKFYNGWGEYIQQCKPRFLVCRFEDYKQNPKDTFGKLLKFAFGLEVKPELLEEALDYYSFENQKKREYQFVKDEKQHFHHKGSSDYTKNIEPETLEMIHKRLAKDLKHNFGYSYPESEINPTEE